MRIVELIAFVVIGLMVGCAEHGPVRSTPAPALPIVRTLAVLTCVPAAAVRISGPRIDVNMHRTGPDGSTTWILPAEVFAFYLSIRADGFVEYDRLVRFPVGAKQLLVGYCTHLIDPASQVQLPPLEAIRPSAHSRGVSVRAFSHRVEAVE